MTLSRADLAAATRGAALGLALLPLSALAEDECTVIQQHRTFSQAAVSLGRNETVAFTNQDDFTHEIYIESPGFAFESDEQEPGTVVRVRFIAPGHFAVHCHIHPKMHLDVDVR